MSEKVCAICKAKPPRENLKLCDECLGLGRNEAVTYTPHTTPDLSVCQTCGNEFEPYLVGPSLCRKTCRPCLMEKKYGHKRGEAVKKKKPKSNLPDVERSQTVETVLDAPLVNFVSDFSDLVQVNGKQLVVDFSKYSDLLEFLREMADQNFRTPDAQVLWMIKMTLMSNTCE